MKEDVVRHDLGRVLLKLEELQDAAIRKAARSRRSRRPRDQRRRPRRPRSNCCAIRGCSIASCDDFERCGVVGEETNKTRWLSRGGVAASAKRRWRCPAIELGRRQELADGMRCWRLLPEEQRVEYSAMTGQSLFYMGETDLKNKVLAIVEEEGASRAAYALKLLQSEGVLDDRVDGQGSGYGPAGHASVSRGRSGDDLSDHDGDRSRRRAAEPLSGADGERRPRADAGDPPAAARAADARRPAGEATSARTCSRLHRNAQRLLKPLFVANPYARELTFLDSQTRTRRDHVKYLTLIRAIALLHQYQRPVKSADARAVLEYIEVTPDDIEIAEPAGAEVLGRSLDELPPQTRRLLAADR